MTIRAIIIDDEPLARELLRSYLGEYSSVDIVAECSDGFDGLKTIQELKPDVIFLDVQMPKITGFEMLELISDLPIVVFTTAYNEYAIKAFEMNAIDYLLKPFSRDRFNKAMEKTRERMKNKEGAEKEIKELVNTVHPEKLERVVVRTGSKVKVIPITDLWYLEAQDDYVMLHTSEGKYLKQQTMKYFEEALDPSRFIRIHRSYIININEMSQIEPYEKDAHLLVLKNNTKLPISKSGYSRLRKILNF